MIQRSIGSTRPNSRPGVDARGSLDEAEKETVVIATFGMPLHPKPERSFGILDGFNGPVRGPSSGFEAGMADDRLLVVTTDLNTITDKGSDPRAFSSADRGPAEGVAAGGMLLMPHNIR